MPPARARCARAVIEYEGTAFAGSQVQPNGRTVQGELEAALNRLTGERVRVSLAGRTDAGVHATGQVAAFCLPPAAAARWASWAVLGGRLNALLPEDLAVLRIAAVGPGFDPRRDAVRRRYRYRVRDRGRRRPTDRHRTLEIDEPLDVGAMAAAAERMVGERDWAAFGSVERGGTVRSVSELVVRRRGDVVEVRITANAFLRRMVRSVVAVLLAVGRGQLASDEVDRLLEGRSRALHGRAAPARGLTLERVAYNRTRSGAGAPATVGARNRRASR